MNQLIFSIIVFVNFNFIECNHHTEVDEGTVAVRHGAGDKIKFNQFPFFGFFGIRGKPTIDPLCSGSLIHPRWVLTSAQCLLIFDRKIDDTIFLYGSINSNYTDNSPGFYYNYPARTYPHLNYVEPDKLESTKNDIGLAKLKDRINETPRQHPILIADDHLRNYAYQYASFINWGNYSSDFPWNVVASELCIIGERECRARTLKSSITDKLHVCGSDYAENIRACLPDAGSPIVVGNRLIGVVSLMKFENCFNEWEPIIFTRVSPYISWIKSHLCHEDDVLVERYTQYWKN